MVYRRLELPPEEIRGLLDEGGAIDHLLRQRERAMSRLDEMRELFGEGFDDYPAEAEQKWGETDARKESQRRAAAYTKAEWVQIKAEGEAVEKALADAPRAGLPADSVEAMDAAEAHRQQVNRSFYDCSPAFPRTLGDLYVGDERYVANYDDAFELPGLARYCRDAIHANADRHERGSAS